MPPRAHVRNKQEQYLVQSRNIYIMIGTEEVVPLVANLGLSRLFQTKEPHARKPRNETALNPLKTNDPAKS